MNSGLKRAESLLTQEQETCPVSQRSSANNRELAQITWAFSLKLCGSFRKPKPVSCDSAAENRFFRRGTSVARRWARSTCNYVTSINCHRPRTNDRLQHDPAERRLRTQPEPEAHDRQHAFARDSLSLSRARASDLRQSRAHEHDR